MLEHSKYEKFGLGVIEAMACGIPTVAPNATTFPEIINNEITLYKPEDPLDLTDKVIALLKDRNLYESIMEYQLIRVRNYFNINVMGEKYRGLYKTLIQ